MNKEKFEKIKSSPDSPNPKNQSNVIDSPKYEAREDVIKSIFHIKDDRQIAFLKEKINNKIEKENASFKTEEEYSSYVNDVFKRLHNEDHIMSIFEVGDKAAIKEYADYMEIPEDKVELMGHYAKLRKETIDKMNLDLARRRLKNEERSEEEESMGVYNEQIEPHVKMAVRSFNKKGLKTKYSGFWGMENQSIGFVENYFSGFKFDNRFLKDMEERGVTISLVPDRISFKVKKKFSLDELEEIWNKIANEIFAGIGH